MSGAGRNFVAFACGRTRSGKSHLLAQLAAKFPRRLVLDFVGEYTGGALKGARESFTLLETVDALRAARRRGPTWTVVACIDPEEVPELLQAIAPNGAATDYGFSRAVGGMVLEVGEVDMIAPNTGGVAPEVRNVFQRGRHHKLSILAAVQRAATAHRIVTSQADLLCAFRQHEPRDADYLGTLMRSEAPELVRTLPPFWYVRYMPAAGLLETVNQRGQVVREHITEAV